MITLEKMQDFERALASSLPHDFPLNNIVDLTEEMVDDAIQLDFAMGLRKNEVFSKRILMRRMSWVMQLGFMTKRMTKVAIFL